MQKKLHIKPNKSLNNLQILFFLFVTGILIAFIGARFVLVGAWPIIIFGIVEFCILVWCTYLFVKKLKKTEEISLDHKTMYLNNLEGEKITERNKFNLNWTKIISEKDSLSISYAGKKKNFAKFLNEKRRNKLKRIIEKYKLFND
tara:strand:+ start:291 stop:725 length:435 start_codon:yes stop_codon:yes gene_type:complete